MRRRHQVWICAATGQVLGVIIPAEERLQQSCKNARASATDGAIPRRDGSMPRRDERVVNKNFCFVRVRAM